jgi:hypothetical protein
MAGPPPLNPMIFSTELLFTIIAVIFCFIIYFKTREIYELTKHKGIRYFRDAFLFFGLSYVVRFIFSLSMFSGLAFDFIVPREMFGPLFILPLGYLSTMGIFYLIFSSIWKRFTNKAMLILGHIIAVLLSIVSFITRSHIMLLYLQSILLIIAVILSFTAKKDGKKLSGAKILYMLVAALWLINLWIIDKGGRRPPFSPATEIFFHLVSLIVFIIIYYKVSKWLK